MIKRRETAGEQQPGEKHKEQEQMTRRRKRKIRRTIPSGRKKNPAYGIQSISRTMRIVALIPQ